MQATYRTVLKCLTVTALASICWNTVSAATIYVPDPSFASVQTAINSASDGDTIIMPAGLATWTSKLVMTKNIALIGAGIDQTIIQDEVPSPNPNFGTVFDISGSGTWRLSSLTITSGSASTGTGQGVISLHGSSHAFRVDNIKINGLVSNGNASNGIVVDGDMWGVIDHCQILNTGQVCIHVRHRTWGGIGDYGDNSWAQPTNLGSIQAVYIEDNLFKDTRSNPVAFQAAIDSLSGARFVARHNTATNMTIGGGHGLDSGGRQRGMRSFEFYNNTITFTSAFPFNIRARSGTGVVFNNTVSSNCTFAFDASNFRDVDPFSPWGAADGNSRYDHNDGVVYFSGTHTGANAATVLTDSTKSFTNLVNNYSLRNTTQNWSSAISANTATTVTTYGSVFGTPRTWNTGDSYQILKCYHALDQPGNGPGALISGSTPTPVAWPNQTSEPIYVWGNTGQNGSELSVNWAHVHAGRDVINSPKPGYTPYIYPHPLVGSANANVPSPPTNLRVVM